MKVAAQEAETKAYELRNAAYNYASNNCSHEDTERSWYNEERTWGQDTCNTCGLFVREVFAADERKHHYRGESS